MADIDFNKCLRIIPRSTAKSLGLKRYFTGSPCKSGHTSERLVINGSCCECARLKSISAYNSNRQENRRKQKIRRDSDPDAALKQRLRRYANDVALASRVAVREEDLAARAAARLAGQSQYQTVRPCPSGHLGMRFINDGKCVECNKLSCKTRAEKAIQADPQKLSEREARRRRNAERAEAQLQYEIKAQGYHIASAERAAAKREGRKTYFSPRPCKKGHIGMRYLGGNCVICSAIYAASQEKKIYDQNYLRNNSEKVRARVSEYRLLNKEKYVAKAKEWAKKNPEKRKVISANYKHKRRAQEESGISTYSLLAWKSSQEKVCYWCGQACSDRFHVDHYLPLSKGGKHDIENLVIACPSCNLKKSAKDPYEFAVSMGKLF